MAGLLLAQATSDNAPGGANFTLWFPLGLFVIVAVILWLLYTRPHNRVPPRRPAHARAGAGAGAAGAGAGQGVGTATGWGHDGPPESGTGGVRGAPGTPGTAGTPGTQAGRPDDDDEGRIV